MLAELRSSAEFSVVWQDWFGRVQQWESPVQSVSVCCAIVVGCLYPHILAALILLALFCYGLHKYTPEAGRVLHIVFVRSIHWGLGHWTYQVLPNVSIDRCISMW